MIKVTGPLSYEVQLLEGYTVHRHVDNLRRCDVELEREATEQDSTDTTTPSDPFEFMPLTLTTPPPDNVPPAEPQRQSRPPTRSATRRAHHATSAPQAQPRRSTCDKNRPDFYHPRVS